MEITEVRVFPVNEDKLKAYATITFDDCFVVRDLKVIHGNSGLFVAMPSKKRKDGSFKDVAHPLNNEFRSKIEKAVLDAYEGGGSVAAGSGGGSSPKDPASAGEGPPEGADSSDT
jgi:stage V sporulation protein G